MENESKSEWSEEFGDLVSSIKKKRAETKRKRDNPFGDFIFPIAMKIASQTIGMNLVSVQPLSAPSPSFMYMDFNGESEEERLKREKFEKRKRVIDNLFGKISENTENEVSSIKIEDVLTTEKKYPIDKKSSYNKWSPIMEELSHNSCVPNWIKSYLPKK